MIQLNINEAVIAILRSAGFYPDTMLTGLLTMLALNQNKVEILDGLDDGNKSKRTILVYYELLKKDG